MTSLAQETSLRSRLLARAATSSDEVSTPGDPADIDKTLQHLTAASQLRRIRHGLYDRPRKNDLTGRQAVSDYRAIIDGKIAANELGFTTAVPTRTEVLVDPRLKPIRLGVRRLYRAGRRVTASICSSRPPICSAPRSATPKSAVDEHGSDER